jgi:DNA-directed RNA polymerase II subunit RPB1
VAAGKTAQNSLDWSNNIIKMVTSGSKGSFINISQVRVWIFMQGCGQRVGLALCFQHHRPS